MFAHAALGSIVQLLYLKIGTMKKSRQKNIGTTVSVKMDWNCGRQFAADTAGIF